MYKETLKELRFKYCMTIEEISNYLNIAKSTYRSYELEKTIIPITKLNDICNYFDISIDYIFKFSKNKNYINNKEDIDLNLLKKRIYSFLRNKRLYEEDLVYLSSYTPNTIYKYLNGIKNISTSFLYHFCKEYKISADYLLGKSNNPNNQFLY